MRRQILDVIRLVWKVPILERLLVRYTIGKEFGTAITKLPPNHYQYKVGTVRRVERDGIRYELDLSDLVDWYIYYGFKEVSRERLYNLVKPDDVVFDIGSNVGDVTMHLALIVGEGGSVHAFEPDPVNLQRLKQNLTLNNFTNIILNKVGLGDVRGSFALYTVNNRNRGMNRILKGARADASSTIQVTTVDAYISASGVSKIDLIKIDVEGFELQVLKGSSDALSKHKPVLFIELDDQNLIEHGANAKELVSFLMGNGYMVHHAETGRLVTDNNDFTNCHYDIIARHNKL